MITNEEKLTHVWAFLDSWSTIAQAKIKEIGSINREFPSGSNRLEITNLAYFIEQLDRQADNIRATLSAIKKAKRKDK